MTSYRESVKFILEMNVTNIVIAEADAHMMHFTQLLNRSSTEYTEAALWNKLVQCNRVYDEYVLKGIFIERPQS